MPRVKVALFAALTALSLVFPQAGPVPAQSGTVPCTDPRGCPDLYVDANRFAPFVQTQTLTASNCQVVEGSTQAGTRKLLRFTFTTPNNGPGDLAVGAPSQHPDLFVFAQCHQHYHFREYADYRLWTPSQFSAWDQLRVANPNMLPEEILAAHPELQPVIGAKAGFCVIDIVQYQAGTPSHFGSCSSDQGISVGWADEYHWSLDGQFVDVTDVADGTYVLEAEVNAERVFIETNYANNRASRTVTLGTGGGGTITLTATGRTDTSGRRFVDLVWTGATGSQVDVYRNGRKIKPTPNDGAQSYRVRTTGTFTWKVCNLGSTTACSNVASVTF